MTRNIPLGVPEHIVALLRYRKKKTGIPITKQLEQLVSDSASATEKNMTNEA